MSDEIVLRLVYWGIGLSGKTSNFQYIYSRIPPDRRSKMTSHATATERLLYFDFLPQSLAPLDGKQVRLRLATVPGAVFYDASRASILDNVDGIVFVADSQIERIEANVYQLELLEIELARYGKTLTDTPVVLQYNKRDLPNAMPVADLDKALNLHHLPTFETCAHTGQGIFDTLRAITKMVLLTKRRSGDP
jgi:mutual gliding-motility protein MglA